MVGFRSLEEFAKRLAIEVDRKGKISGRINVDKSFDGKSASSGNGLIAKRNYFFGINLQYEEFAGQFESEGEFESECLSIAQDSLAVYIPDYVLAVDQREGLSSEVSLAPYRAGGENFPYNSEGNVRLERKVA